MSRRRSAVPAVVLLDRGKMDGLVLLEKVSGITSFTALNGIKTVLGTRKVGHCGTLDKFARGLLLLLTGSCTRLVPYFSALDKRYSAVVRFGERTDTLDPEGKVVDRGKVPRLEDIQDALGRFVGTFEQVPPIYSAVHHDGVRAYRLARAGMEPRLKSRRVSVYQLEALDYKPPDLRLRVHCSKGTYVRSLARDIGKAIGSCAYLAALERTAVGPFRLEAAVTAGEFRRDRDVVPPIDFLKRLPDLQIVGVRSGLERRILSGMALEDGMLDREITNGDAAVFGGEDRLLCIIRRGDGRIRYVRVFDGGA